MARGDPQFGRVKKHVVLYGLAGGILIALLRLVEYRFLVVEHSLEIYGGIVAAVCAGVGLWFGMRLTAARPGGPPGHAAVSDPVRATPPAAAPDTARPESLGLTPRELEILRLMAAGMSNREIAATLFVSENTVKTHSSRLFEKLGAKRRTQAVQLGRQHALIP